MVVAREEWRVIERAIAIAIALSMLLGAGLLVPGARTVGAATLTLADFPNPFLSGGTLSGNLVLGLSQSKTYNGVIIGNASSTIDVVGGVPIGGSLGAKGTAGLLGALLDTDAVSADGRTIVAPGNLLGIGGRGNNLYTKIVNPSLPVRLFLTTDVCQVSPPRGIFASETKLCYYNTGVNPDGSVDTYGFISINFDVTSGRYTLVAAGLSGFATRGITQLIAQSVAGQLPTGNNAGSILTGTGVVVKFHDQNADNIFETYQVVDGSGGAVQMASAANIPQPTQIARLFSIGLSQTHGVATAASTIDVVGGVTLASRMGRDLQASGAIWAALDQEVVATDGVTLLDRTHNLVSLGGRGNNLVTRYYNPSFCVRIALNTSRGDPTTDGNGRGLFNCINGNNWANTPTASYAMDTFLTDAANGNRGVEVVAGLSGFATRLASVALADGSESRGNNKGIVMELTDSNGDGILDANRLVDKTSGVTTYQFYDLFNVPWKEYMDLRTAAGYGEYPIGANCFNQTSTTEVPPICNPVTYPSVPAVAGYPYTDWLPSSEVMGANPKPGSPNMDNWVQAPMRAKIVGNEIPGYNLSSPVFLPVLNYGAAPGNRLDFNWKMSYLDVANYNQEKIGNGCSGLSTNDGYVLKSHITLTMDLQQSRRMFGVVATDFNSARNWWSTHTSAACGAKGTAETALENWFVAMGGSSSTVGKYDIANAFQWYYQPFFTNMTGVVDTDGTTHVTVDHAAWGTEALMSRMLFWGNTSYAQNQNYLNASKATGWLGMESFWWDDFNFTGSFAATTSSFNLKSNVDYLLAEWAYPGPDGLLNQQGDIPYWWFGGELMDYVTKFSPAHQLSELDAYNGRTFVRSDPGNVQYSLALAYDYMPSTWNLKLGSKWIITVPTTAVTFHDPNMTPKGAWPNYQYVATSHTMAFYGISWTPSTSPYTVWDPAAGSLTVRGPIDTGGPPGTPSGGYPAHSYPTFSWTPGP